MTSENITPVDRLVSALEPLPEAVRGLRADVHAAEAARQKANRLNTFLLLVAVVLAALVAVVGIQNNKLAREVKATNATIADCSTAGGRCYEESRGRLAGAISAVVQISIYVSQCGRLYPGESGPEYDKKIEACVRERLADATQPSTSPSTGS